MAPELEDHWFVRKGRWCGATSIGWQGALLTTLYVAVVTAATSLLLDRTLIGFVAVVLLATAIFVVIVAAKTSGGIDR